MTPPPMTVGALILAAGRSSRMGNENKLLADMGGMPMVARVARAALVSRARPVAVVTGHGADNVRAALANLAVEFVHNPDYARGMSTSLKAGIEALRKTGVAGALVLLGDMPRITATTIDSLVAAFEASGGRTV